MNAISWAGLLLFTVLAAGCSRANPLHSSEPLTLEKWKTLPPQTKYEVSTLERLKQNNPKLEDDRAWEEFARTELIPARKDEFPEGIPRK